VTVPSPSDAGSNNARRAIRVLIVDDDALVRGGLRLMLGGVRHLEVVGEAADGDEVPAAVRTLRPDVVLMDIRMARVDGLSATRQVRGQADAPEVIVLTTFDADEQVLAALRAGAAGFLLKDTPPSDIVRAIEAVAAGDAMLSAAVTRRLIAMVGNDPGAATRQLARARLAELTERELDVAGGVGRGLSNAEIAAETYMSVATVKAYVSRLLLKLDLTNRVQVALLVHEADLSDVTLGRALRSDD
jgi:DNA-binding NarL/FixJ family response regulator